MKITKEHQSLLRKITKTHSGVYGNASSISISGKNNAEDLVKEIEEQRDLERSRKSIQAVKEMMTVLNKQ